MQLGPRFTSKAWAEALFKAEIRVKARFRRLGLLFVETAL